jgi:hypothetical protein
LSKIRNQTAQPTSAAPTPKIPTNPSFFPTAQPKTSSLSSKSQFSEKLPTIKPSLGSRESVGDSNASVPVNNVCESALELPVTGTVFVGSAVNASFDKIFCSCSTIPSDSRPRVWFKFISTDGIYVDISTCHFETDSMHIWRNS